MFCTFYWTIVVLSAILVLGTEIYYNRELDKYFLAMEILVPIISMGYLMRTDASSVHMAEWGNRFVYFEGSFFMALCFLCLMRNMNIPVKRITVAVVYGAAGLIFMLNFLGTWNGIYYKTIGILTEPMGTIFVTEAGTFKFLHMIYLVGMLLLMLGIIIHGLFNPKKYSYKVLLIYGATVVFAFAVYMLQAALKLRYDISPAMLLIVMAVYTFANDFINSRNMNEVANFVLKESEIERGFISFDKEKRFLGANEDAYNMFPELKKLSIEHKITNAETNMLNVLLIWMDEYTPKENDRSIEGKYKVSWSGDKAYKYVVHATTANHRYVRSGYYFEISDVTANQKYIEMVRTTNKNLKDEVEIQTNQIAGMQSKVVFGLANMIENRDFSTGGHVKRTSDVVKILVDELKREGDERVTDEFMDDIVRAAPMHDLGKIAVDNAILQKPAKLTSEEYEQMKVHSDKSGRIVHGILEGVEEEHFVDVSYNIARYHHERWDGKGYPEGLTGDEIPFEARIMAIADVYDALVSSRCYKEAMGYEEAYCEIMKNMGSQFDPSLKKAFNASVKSLEKYYNSEEDTPIL